jgi:hypothetical protein
MTIARSVTLEPGYSLGDFQALLDSRQFVIANCFTIVPREGAIIRLCDTQRDVSVVSWGDVSRHTYGARQAVLSGLRASASMSAEVDEQDISIAYAQDALFQAWRPWPEALLMGRLDGAAIYRDWAVGPRFGSWLGVTRMFGGLVSELDSVGRSIATLKVKSDLERLNIQMPRDQYTPKCRNIFGDFRCGIDLNGLGVLGAVGVGATRSVIPWASSGATYAYGKIHIGNADDVTRVRTVRDADASNLYLSYPLDFDPSPALEFTAFPGCSRLAARCEEHHGPTDWLERFAGTPFIPVAETAF